MQIITDNLTYYYGGKSKSLRVTALDGVSLAINEGEFFGIIGQTGSGKTYTMQGVGEGRERGIVPRSIEMVVEDVAKLREVGWEYEIAVSFVEIYREMLRDLLVDRRQRAKLEVKLDVAVQRRREA